MSRGRSGRVVSTSGLLGLNVSSGHEFLAMLAAKVGVVKAAVLVYHSCEMQNGR
jgi:hypothetical protein